MRGKEAIECQINCFSINQFYKTVDDKAIEFPFQYYALDHFFYTNVIAYCQQNWYVRLAIYTDLLPLNKELKKIKG